MPLGLHADQRGPEPHDEGEQMRQGSRVCRGLIDLTVEKQVLIPQITVRLDQRKLAQTGLSPVEETDGRNQIGRENGRRHPEDQPLHQSLQVRGRDFRPADDRARLAGASDAGALLAVQQTTHGASAARQAQRRKFALRTAAGLLSISGPWMVPAFAKKRLCATK
ncbi:hypothetical protein VAPA_2c06050 [Variovorax paradoxus B4]|uniref:Uncharacterized protein n=1 Tax=Variovorax paradoxus B4 TaxID=1246301 RepID=T1XLK4_VARPD|nr:hypothetical protein VAPA_2c06050 [Variovorax paradoxus B4]